MQLTRAALSNPVAAIAAMLLIVMLGTIALLTLPIQMIPGVQRPFIQIKTGWHAAAPQEVESEIVEQREHVLRGLPGLVKMESSVASGFASINFIFSVETELQRALVLRREGNSVFRVTDDSAAEQIGIVTGLGAGRLIEIIGDVRPGDRIVVRGAEHLAPGMAVSVGSETASAPAPATLN